MIWIILALLFLVLSIYLHKSADRLENSSMTPSQDINNETKSESYWEKYLRDYPSKAKSITSQIDLEFASMTDKDVKEIISSVERMATSLKCGISEIKETYLKEISKYPKELLPEMIASTSREIKNEANAYKISPNNTMTSIMVRWLKEKHDSIGNPDAQVTKNAEDDEIKILKELCPFVTEDIDIKERLKSLREASLLCNCPMKDLKVFYLSDMKQSYDGSYEHFHYLPETLKYLAGKSLEKANHAGVKPDNTIYTILFEWLNDFVKEERERLLQANEVVCPRCNGRHIKLGFFKDEFECNTCGNRFGGL